MKAVEIMNSRILGKHWTCVLMALLLALVLAPGCSDDGEPTGDKDSALPDKTKPVVDINPNIPDGYKLWVRGRDFDDLDREAVTEALA